MTSNDDVHTAAGRAAAHRVPTRWLPDRWPADPEQRFVLPEYWRRAPELPSDLREQGTVSRVELRAIAAEARAGRRPWSELLVASYAWGYALAPYGPFRLRRLLGDADNRTRLEPTLGAAAARVRKDPVAAYALLRNRVEDGPGALKWYGPAFFTRFLTFASRPARPALILDQVLAGAVRRLAADPDLLRGSSWSADEYAFYLGFVGELARRPAEGTWQPPAGLGPEGLERALYQVELHARVVEEAVPAGSAAG